MRTEGKKDFFGNSDSNVKRYAAISCVILLNNKLEICVELWSSEEKKD